MLGLEQPIPCLLCMQEVCSKNSVDWNLVSEDVKDIDWHEIIRSSCPVSSLSKALLHVNKLWVDNRCVLAHRAKQKAYRVWSRSN